MIKATKNKEIASKTQVVVRQIASAFRQVEDFEPFVKGLEAALGKAEFFDRAAISLFPRLKAGEEHEPGTDTFPDGTMALPLSGREGVNGVVHFANERHPFGPEDLHLMAGLGDLLAVLVEHAGRFGEQRRNLTLLGFLMNQAPVGVACFDAEKSILVSNALGRRLLGVGTGEEHPWVLPGEWAEDVQEARPSGSFYRHTGGRLLHVEVKAAPSTSGEEITALVLADLTAEDEKFRETLARETYRCGWLGLPVTLGMISAPTPGKLMALLRPLRQRLGAAAFVGPCNGDSIGVVFPETTFAQAMENLRGARSLLESDWEVGVATSGHDRGNPEELLASALTSKQPVASFLQPNLLLHDDYPSINDMLELILRDHFRVLKSSDFKETTNLLKRGQFDGFFSEIDLSQGASAWDLVRTARQANPNIRPFLTSCAANSRRHDPRFRDEMIFQKPFDVKEVLGHVKNAFS